MFRRPRMLAVLGLGLAVLAISAAMHQAPAHETTSNESTPLATGLRAFVDPETGELRAPTAEELAHSGHDHAVDLGKLPDIEIVEHANGMRSAVLDERFMSTSVAKIGPDGRLITDCVTSQEQLDAFLADSDGPEVQ